MAAEWLPTLVFAGQPEERVPQIGCGSMRAQPNRAAAVELPSNEANKRQMLA